MFTYTGSREHFRDLINDPSEATLTIGDRLINTQIKRLLGKRNWNFLEKTVSITTVASQQFYDIPASCSKIKSMYTTVSSTRYVPHECDTREMWDRINQSVYTSDIPEYFFQFNGQLGIWPVPATSSNIMTVTCLRAQRDLSIADYNTGNITTATNGGYSVVGSATGWVNSMVGSYLRITEGLSGVYTASKGDGVWYEIESVTSGTGIDFTKPYEGTTLSSASAAYVIGQASIIPEEYQDIPIIGAAYMYYKVIKPELDIAKDFKAEYDDRYAEMVSDYGQKTTSPVLNDDMVDIINPNLTIRL